MTKQIGFFLLALTLGCSAYIAETDFEQVQNGSWFRNRLRSVQYPPPLKEDVAFVETSGGDLGKVHFRSDGVIQIPLWIDRYFGDQEERDRQLEIGALPESLYLYLPAWDVDVHGGGSYCHPECDQALLNDYSLGALTGDNQIWQMNIFSIPIDQIHFPEAPGEKARNLLEVFVDTANSGEDYWCTAIDWVALLIPAPRPLLLIHGWWSSAETWGQMRRKIREMYGVPTWPIDVGPQNSIEENARRIQQHLAGEGGLKKLFGVEQFNILAHSKGGLDSRWYSNRKSNPEFCGDIHQVLQIATPNQGSRMASYLFDSSELPWYEQEILQAVGLWVDLKTAGTYCLTQEYCECMNELCPPAASAVPVKVVAGRVPDRYLGIFGVDLFPVARRAYGHYDEAGHPAFWGDGVVSVASAHAKVSALASSPLHGQGYDHIGIIYGKALETARVYREEITERKAAQYSAARMFGSLTYRGGSPTRSLESVAKADEDEESPAWEAVQQSAAGVLAPEQQKQHAFFLQYPQKLKFIFIGMQPGIRILVQSPDGTVCNSDHPEDGIKFAELPEGEEVPMKSLLAGTAMLEWTIAKAGICTVTLEAYDLPKETGYQIWLEEEKNAFSFQCWLEHATVAVGQEFRMFCRGKYLEEVVDASVLSADLLAEFISEKGVESFPGGAFRDDGLSPDDVAGDRIFTAAFVCPKRGDYRFTACAQLHLPSGSQVTARGYAAGQGSLCSARVTSCSNIEAVDLNQNQMYDEFQATCQLEIDKPGKYSLSGSLLDDKRETIAFDSSKILELAIGNQQIILHFSTEKIFLQRADGPYWVSELQLLEWSADGTAPVPLEKAAWVAASAPLSYFAFEHDPILLTGEGLDCGIDQDGDAVLDQLHVELDLLLAPGSEGNYQWSGTLFDENKRNVASAHAAGFLESSQDASACAQLVFDFDGDEIATARFSGNYSLGGISIWGARLSQAVYLPGDYQTLFYQARSFVKNLTILEVTEQVQLEYSNWRVNPDNGSLLTTITMSNISGKAGKPLELVFWLVLPSAEQSRLVRIDGKTPEGKEYMDVTTEVEAALRKTGNADQKLDLGESVEFEVAVFSRDRSIPDPQLFSFWADPPIQAGKQRQNTLDRDNNEQIDDWEMLQAVEEWHQGKVSDETLLDAVEVWQTGTTLEGHP
ncbi:MAG: choice-of-anchor X domain-containing protein [Lentisphaeria bacterium]